MNTNIPWATLGLWALTLIVAIVGGVVVIWGKSGALDFATYVKVLGAFAVAHGLLGIGRGVNSGLTNHALVTSLPDNARVRDAQDEQESSQHAGKHA